MVKSFALVCAFIASVSCEAYTIGQVAHGATYGGIITGVDYGHGHVSGYGAIGNRGIYGNAHPGAYYGKRDAEAEPEAYTIGQVAHGLPIHNAYATGHPHNVGVVTGVSYGHGLYGAHHGLYYGKREAEAEAKPYYYGGYGGYGYSRPGYSYGTYGHAHHGYYYGKREAE